MLGSATSREAQTEIVIELQSAMVSNATLAAICVSCGLQDHLLFDSHQLAVNIREYAQNITERADQEYQEAEAERRRPGQYWAGIEPPKVSPPLLRGESPTTECSPWPGAIRLD